MAKREKKEGRHVCKCDCGGALRGVEEFGRLWTWCEKCTPVVKFNPRPSPSVSRPNHKAP